MRPGDRVELVSTPDEYTRLEPGDRGTVDEVVIDRSGTEARPKVWVDWDGGARLAMLYGIDHIRRLDDE